jgi:hypothetical protein
MKTNYLIISFLFFSASLYSQNYCTITGNVSNAESGRKIIGAKVLIKNLNLRVSTDVNGNFTIENIPEGKHILKVSRIDYLAYQDTIAFSSENKNVNITISLKYDRPEIISKPEIEDYQNRLQKLAQKDSLLRIHTDSMKYQNGGVIVYLTFTNLSDETLYIIKELPCFHIMKPLVYNEDGFVNANCFFAGCDVIPYPLINESDLIKLEPHKSVSYPPKDLLVYNFNFLPIGKYKVGIKYTFGGPSSLTGLYSKPQDDAILIALRGEYFSDNFMFFTSVHPVFHN